MPNRYCNLTGTNRISEEYDNINDGFDGVQLDMDTKAPINSPALTGTPTAPTQTAGNNSTRIATTAFVTGAAGTVQTDLNTHKADDVRHMTTADRNKLAGIQAGAQVNAVTSVAGRTGAVTIGWDDVQSKPSSTPAAIDSAVNKVGGIQAGAQVNQNAIAKINDITAASPSDTFTVTGGTGISVTSNPTTKTLNITATGTSTPGAHASSHLPDGSDPIPTATTSNGGLMSAADKATIDQLKDKVTEGQTIPAPINRGVNIINTTQASGATMQVKGRTLVNILGNDGGCESLAAWPTVGSVTTSTTIKKSGNSSFKISSTGSTSYVAKDFNYKLDVNKQYILGAWVYVESYTSGVIVLRLYEPGGFTTSRYTAYTNTSFVGGWQFVYIKIPTANTLTGNGFRMYFGLTSSQDPPTAVAYFDEVRLYEVSAADYAAIGTTITGDAIDAYLPYVDGVKHLQGASVRKTGKNLLAGVPDSIHAYATLNASYDLTLNATGTNQSTYIGADVVGGQTYTLSAVMEGEYTLIGRMFYDATGQVIGSYANVLSATGSVSMTAPSGAVRITLALVRGSATTGTIRFRNWMLVLGSADQLPVSFEPRVDQYAHCPVPLASSVDRSIADNYDSATGHVFRRWRTGVKLDGALNWGATGTVNGSETVKQLTVPNFPGMRTGLLGNILVRYDGMPYREGVALTGDANIFQSHSNGTFYLNIVNSDAGWIHAVNPNVNATKALMNGWKANGNNGTVYNSWVSILNGAAPATNTEAYVAANKAPGWDAWATLDYVLAAPVTEQLSGDLGGLALDAGGNTVELLEGVVVREEVTPEFNSAINTYVINRIAQSGSLLSKRTNRILAVHKDNAIDYNWAIVTNDMTYNGGSGARIAASDYDPNATYTVTYEVLDRYLYTSNAIDATLTYQSTLGGAVAQATQDIASLKQHDGVQDFAIDYIEAKADNVAFDLAQINGVGVTAGSGTAYTLTLATTPTLSKWMRFTIQLHTANTGAATLNVNGAGAKPILKPNGSTLSSGNLKANSIYTVVYDGANFILQGEGGEYGTAAAADVLWGKTIGTEAGIVSGTMPNRGAYNITPSNSAQSIPAGYHSGGGQVAAVTFDASKVLTGTTIAGTPGTMADRSGDTAALSSAVSGTTLKLRASEGYRDGINDYVTISDSDFIPANLALGMNLFGVVGNGGNVTRRAMGTGTPDNNLLLTVGLSFLPRFIIAYRTGSSVDTPNIDMYVADMSTSHHYRIASGGSLSTILISGSQYVNSSGFSLSMGWGGATNWVAIE